MKKADRQKLKEILIDKKEQHQFRLENSDDRKLEVLRNRVLVAIKDYKDYKADFLKMKEIEAEYNRLIEIVEKAK